MAERNLREVKEILDGSKPRSLADRIDSNWKVLVLIGAILAAGWASKSIVDTALDGKADAASVTADHDQLSHDHEDLITVKADVYQLRRDVVELHNDNLGTREDLRALFPMAQLAPIAEGPKPMPTPRATFPIDSPTIAPMTTRP